jgi:hypothetical protein
VLIFVESRNQGDMDKKRHLDCISQSKPLSPAQGKVARVNIILMPSSLDKDEKRLKEESSWQAQAYSYVFYFFLLSIGRYTIKRDATWWSWQKQSAHQSIAPREIPRVMRGNKNLRVCWNLSYRSDWYCTLVKLVGPILEQVRSGDLSSPFTEF